MHGGGGWGHRDRTLGRWGMGTHDYYLLGGGDRASATLKSSLSVREILSLPSGDSPSMKENGLYPYWSRVTGKPTAASLRGLHRLSSPLGIGACWYLEGANRLPCLKKELRNLPESLPEPLLTSKTL